MKRIPVFLVVLVLALLVLSGCAYWDGLTGAPIEKTDNPTLYHLGQMTLPFLSQLFSIIQRIWLPTGTPAP